MKKTLLAALILCGGVIGAAAQAPQEEAPRYEADPPVYYVAERTATLYRQAGGQTPRAELDLREPLHVLESADGWSRVRTPEGLEGYVETAALSNVWIRVSKRRRMVYFYRGSALTRKIPADFGVNFFADKEQRGGVQNPDDWRTPEGVFYVARKNPHSQFYKALVLNYPTAEDARRGLQRGFLSRDEYEAIVQAEADFEMPPMHTALGGWIEIHGGGTGGGTNWTQGCVAIRDEDLDAIWAWVDVGTPVLIEP